MAETVKKSRIVSEDNLEESLMEEFNLRLKSMSQDTLENEEIAHEETERIYENIETIRTTECVNIKAISKQLIETERAAEFDDDSNAVVKNGRRHIQNGHDNADGDAQIVYETVVTKTTTSYKGDTEIVNDTRLPSESDPIYEEVERIDITEICTKPSFTLSPIEPNDPSAENTTTDTKSSKNKMFLSSDDSSCLLFTQTVTSPMLTPSEEGVDFLKGFRRESSANASPENEDCGVENKPKEQQAVPTETEDLSSTVTKAGRDVEEIYENLKEENIYENIREVDAALPSKDGEDSIYQNIEDFRSNQNYLKENESGIDTESEESRGASDHEEEHALEEVSRGNDVSEKESDSQGVPSSINVSSVIEVSEGNSSERKEIRDLEEFIQHERDTHSSPLSEHLDLSLDDNDSLLRNDCNIEKHDPKNDVEIVVDLVDSEPEEIETFESSPSEAKWPIEDVPSIAETPIEGALPPEDVIDATAIPPDVDRAKVGATRTKIVDEIVKTMAASKEAELTITNKEKDTESVPSKIVSNLTSQFLKGDDGVAAQKRLGDVNQLKSVDIMKQINMFEQKDDEDDSSTQITESYVETTAFDSNGVEKALKKKKSKKSRKEEKENISVKSSFSKFDALQKKNVLHVRSSDSAKAQEKFNGTQADTSSNCKCCSKPVFQMEQIKAEKAIWHKNCFRCIECGKQLTVDTYQSHEGTLYCKAHFKALFAPKAIDDEDAPKPRKPELIIRENQPLELPPDVIRASDKPDLGLEELQSLNVKERFQVFQQYQNEINNIEKVSSVNVKRSPSILSKLAKFQSRGMDVGVADDALNGIPIEESSSEEEVEEEIIEGEDVDLVKAKRVQKEKPFHFTGMSDVKNKWEHGEQNTKDERREERKQEIQTIRNRLFMGKQGKMKEAYQQAVMESESCQNMKKTTQIDEVCDTRSIKERFEKGEVVQNAHKGRDDDDMEVFESEISKNSRSLFLELDANSSKAPQLSPITPPKLEVKKAREAYITKSSSQDTVKSSELVDDVTVRTADIQQRFKFFEKYREPEKTRKQFRITPPREGQDKGPTPERELYHDPDVVRSEENVEDSVVAKESHTATKMLNKFRLMEENLSKESTPQGLKPLKRFTPPPEPARTESSSEEGSESEEESEADNVDHNIKVPDDDLLEAQKAARAKQLRAKFEKWEANEIKKEQNNSSINIMEEYGEEQSQIESTKLLRARFESMRESSNETNKAPRVKVNRFVELSNIMEQCEGCEKRVYPLEKISVHGHTYHKSCFKCMECNTILRMDSYSYNQGRLYCMPHFKRLFISKGNYDTAFGLDQHKEKWNAVVA